MVQKGGSFAQLGADDVIRFLDAEHFLEEMAGNLGRGRAIVRTRRIFEIEDRLRIQVEAPNVDWTVGCEARVVVVRDGFVGLELLRFEQDVLPKLDALGTEAETNRDDHPAERTVIAPMPDLGPARTSTSEAAPRIESSGTHEAETGDLPAVASDESAAVGNGEQPRIPAMRARRRRPRPAAPDAAGLSPEPADRPPPDGRPSNRRPEPARTSPPPAASDSDQEMDFEPGDVTAGMAAPSHQPPPIPTDPPPDGEDLSTRSNLPIVEDEGGLTANLPRAEDTPVGLPTDAVGQLPQLAEQDLVVVQEGSQLAKNPLLAPSVAADGPPPDASTMVEEFALDGAEFEPIAVINVPRPRAETVRAPGPPLDPSEMTHAEDPAEAAPPPDPVQAEAPSLEVSPSADGLSAESAPESLAEIPGLAPRAPTLADDLVDAPDDFESLEVPALPDDVESLEVPALPNDVESLEVPALPNDVADLPEPEPKPPASAVPLDNLEALDDKHPALPKITRGGVLRVTDAATLLGLYLAQIRHGRLTVLGDLEGPAGASVTIKVVGPTVVSLQAEIVARIGQWVTVSIEDVAPLQEVLRDAADDWRSEVDAISPPSEAVPAVAPVPEAPAPESEPPKPAAAAAALDSDEHTPAPAPADDGPPEVPRLAGSRVVFRRAKDLSHELQQNLRNGGLFVESSPLPIRTKRQLTVQVGTLAWPVELQADVVFADGGRVGFSVMNAAEATVKIEDLLTSFAATKDVGLAAMSGDLVESSQLSASPSADQDAYIGSLKRPLSDANLLGLPERRIDDLSSVTRIGVLQLTEHIVAQRWRGVLKLVSGDHQVQAWFHDGSVAFVTAKPYDEASSLGRILINQKKLSDAGLREALEASRNSSRSVGRALVSLGHIKKSDLSTALREQMRMKLGEALTFESGNFEWTPWREPPGDADLVLTRGVGVLAHHIRHRFEALNLSEIEALFGKNLARPVGHEGDLDQSTQGMHLQPRELRFLEMQLDGRRSVQDAVRGSPVGRLASLRLVALGLAMGVLRFTDGGRAPREATRIGVAPNRFDAVKKELQENLHLFKSMNYFEILGVHWSAHHHSFKDAYAKVKKQYDPNGRGIKDAPADVKALARQLQELIDQAFSVIQNVSKRTEYRKELFDATEREYAADMLVKQGEVALMRSDRVGAIEALETAVELNPSARNRQLLTTAREGRR